MVCLKQILPKTAVSLNNVGVDIFIENCFVKSVALCINTTVRIMENNKNYFPLPIVSYFNMTK